jgi:hypothetical protein
MVQAIQVLRFHLLELEKVIISIALIILFLIAFKGCGMYGNVGFEMEKLRPCR